MKTVYLAGPIGGLTESEAKDWRTYVDERLADETYEIQGVSPLRCEPAIKGKYDTTADQQGDPRFGTAKAIYAKNMYDVRNCDMTLAYVPKPKNGERYSWGTMCELVLAHQLGKGTILVTDDPAVVGHPLLYENTGWIVDNFEDAVDIVIGVLGGYTYEGKNV